MNQAPQQQQQQQDSLCSTQGILANNANTYDLESARRLAKRLYNLSGFKRSDVCHHLGKNNPFSKMVAQEYVNLFDFKSMKLDCALRKFLSKLQLNGETQERERMLSQFSERYYQCNSDKFPSADIVQTLVCALILLNTDLHGGYSKKKRSKLGLGAFIDGLNSSVAALSSCQNPDSTTVANAIQLGLAGTTLNDLYHHSEVTTVNNLNTPTPYTFPRHLLVDLYESIKKRPLKSSDDKCDMTSLEVELDKIYSQQQVGSNRFNTMPTRRFVPGSNSGLPSSTLNASVRRHLKLDSNKLVNDAKTNFTNDATNNNNPNYHQQKQHSHDVNNAILFKCGYLNKKRISEAGGKATSKGRRSWRRVYVILQDLRLIMQLGVKEDESTIKEKQPHHMMENGKTATKVKIGRIAQHSKNILQIHHVFAKRSTSYTKREFVFQLRLADHSEFLLQANDESDMNSWIDAINFATACLSSPALPKAITNSSKQCQQSTQKPLLPAAYTRLSYWEQLINHEEHFQKLKLELEEHLAEAPNTKNANKRAKLDFIEKIAYLKETFERYSVYVDLMRRKSNSPEAIILSRHPHIASLTPSKEMILSLPCFAPPKLLTENPEETLKSSTG